MEESSKPEAVSAPSPIPSKPAAQEQGPSPSSRCSCSCKNASSAVSKTDYTIRRIDKFISTFYGQEKALAMTGYTAQMIHYALSSSPSTAIQNRIRALLNLKSGAPPLPTNTTTTPPLLILSSLITDTRTTLRLFGLIGLWTWGSDTLRSPPRDRVLRAIAFAQVFTNIVYQVLENVAHLASKGILNQSKVERWGSLGKWWIWSTRAWLGHHVLDFVRLARLRQLAARRKRAGEKVDEVDEERALRKSLLNNMAWTPLCLHWSFENGVGIPNYLIGWISFAANSWIVADLWRATA